MGFIEQMGTLYQEWGIRVVVMLSLLCQVLLQLLGNRRKFSRSLWLRIFVWGSYVSADSITTFALGAISTKLVRIGDLSRMDRDTKLNVLWAPCLLVLLGGPDSITAYSVEDNELWLRHVLGLGTQTLFTGYLIFLAWSADYLSYMSLSLLVVGVVKYGERVLVLWQVSFDKLRSEYVKLTQEKSGRRVSQSFLENELGVGYVLFKIFRHIFLNQRLHCDARDVTVKKFNEFTHQKAFRIIEMELGFMYDLLHTKAKTTYTCWGLCRRFMTSTISCIVLAVFSYWFVNKTSSDDNYPRIDVVVTIVLLATIILSEIYWVCMLLSSDWAELEWIMKQKSWFTKLWTSDKNVVRDTLLQLFQQSRWSNSTGQLSFFSLFRYHDDRLLKRLHLHDTVGPYYYPQHVEITDYIKRQIFEMIKKVNHDFFPYSNTSYDSPLKRLFLDYRELLKYACADVCPAHVRLENNGLLADEYDFEDIIKIWHVATELCYSYDHDTSSSPHSDERNAAMLLSRYMFYILIRYPLMLQTVNSNVNLEIFWLELVSSNTRWQQGGIKDAKKILKDAKNSGWVTRDGQSYCATILAKQLMIDGGENTSNPWRFLLNSWLAHLIYAAYHCREEDHTRQLREGGEFLTHVWMLLVHLGLTNHFDKRYKSGFPQI